MTIKAHIASEKVSSNTVEARTLFEKSMFGEKTSDKITYSAFEALFLVEKKKMLILDSKDKELKKEKLESLFSKKDKKFRNNYAVFRDLRNKGHIVKSALKFGADFRVYEKSRPKDHAKWLVLVTTEKEKLSWQDFAAKNRISHSTNKKLLVAVVDEEENVTYFETSWVKP